MKIPLYTQKEKYYVASAMHKAFSSWNTYQDALDCIKRFKDSDDKFEPF